LEQLVESGQIEELQPGQSLKILHDQRPHPNVVNHLDALIRDVSVGTGFFPRRSGMRADSAAQIPAS
ncbi:MAG: hypothetical protein RJB12_1004, partial [Pseudomonadota bacterium]